MHVADGNMQRFVRQSLYQHVGNSLLIAFLVKFIRDQPLDNLPAAGAYCTADEAQEQALCNFVSIE